MGAAGTLWVTTKRFEQRRFGQSQFGLVDTNYPPDNETDLGLVMSGYVAISILKGISTGTPTGHDIRRRYSVR